MNARQQSIQATRQTWGRSTCAGLLSLLIVAAGAVGQFVPDGRLKPDDYTVLMACDARHSPELQPFQAGPHHGKFFVRGWTRSDQYARWTVSCELQDSYAVNVLLRRNSGGAVRVTVSAGDQHASAVLPGTAHAWQRLPLEGVLALRSGSVEIELKLQSAEADSTFNADVLSVELVRPAVRDELHAAAKAMRAQADVNWFRDGGFGLMVHWTSQTMPRHGEALPYAQAVERFDVETFAQQVAQTGARFVTLTTSHGQMYFPAPLPELDEILPGRTTRRDLIADLAAALERRGIRLMLYYHLGAISDRPWLEACGFWKTDTSELWHNWCTVIEAVGRRYGQSLAGWWFDDGSVNYYYRSAPWQRLARAAKAGHPGRIICFNPWELPPATEFQDYYAGEGNTDPTVGGHLRPQHHGRISSGVYRGLQASAALIFESDWLHTRRDQPIPPPRFTAQQVADMRDRFAAHHNVLILNLEIYQDGTFSPDSVRVLAEAQRMRN